MKISRLLFPLVFGTAIAVVLWFGAGWQASGAAQAAVRDEPPSQLVIRYVATTGSDTTDCTNSATPCATIQYAVDQSGEGDEIRVAGGEYTDVHTRIEHDPNPPDQSLIQTVFITQPLTLRGGYTLTNWTVSDPAVYPTTIHPQGQGRGIVVISTEDVTIEGFRVIGGDATVDGYALTEGGGIGVFYAIAVISDSFFQENVGLGGIGVDHSTAILQGNVITGHLNTGIYGLTSTVTMTQNSISGNTGYEGGGIHFYGSDIYIAENTLANNTATFLGGGMYVYLGNWAVIVGNTFVNNTADLNGGGMLLVNHQLIDIAGNTFIGNSAESTGGGLFFGGNEATFRNNLVQNNTTGWRGGGVYANGGILNLYNNDIRGNYSDWDGGGATILGSQISLGGNSIISNTAQALGGGVMMQSFDGSASVFNNVVANNHIVESFDSYDGSGLFMFGGRFTAAHNTIANNHGGDDSGIFITAGTFTMTNNIIISHTLGLEVSWDTTAFLESTLWGNDIDWLVNGSNITITTGTINLWGNPGFVDPTNSDYHITPDSVARDAGVDVGVTTDIDDDSRPQGVGFDIGADEILAFYLPIGIVQAQGHTEHSGAVVTAWSSGTIVATTTTDSSGAYWLTIPDGIYTITIERPLYLDAIKTDVPISNASAAPLVPVTLKGGDANDSDKINISDLALIGSHYGLMCDDPDWDARADINGDCTVDLLDLTLAAGNYGKTSPVFWD